MLKSTVMTERSYARSTECGVFPDPGSILGRLCWQQYSEKRAQTVKAKVIAMLTPSSESERSKLARDS